VNFIENSYAAIFKKEPIAEDYYHATIKPTIDSYFISIFTKWYDFEKSGKYEVRRADLVMPDKVVFDFRNTFNDKIAVIDTKEELLSLMNFGGHAIISKELMDIN
jgi:hypothetical protein